MSHLIRHSLRSNARIVPVWIYVFYPLPEFDSKISKKDTEVVLKRCSLRPLTSMNVMPRQGLASPASVTMGDPVGGVRYDTLLETFKLINQHIMIRTQVNNNIRA